MLKIIYYEYKSSNPKNLLPFSSSFILLLNIKIIFSTLGDTVVSAPSSPSNQSTATLVGSNNSSENQAENGVEKQKAAQSPKHTTSPAKEEVPSKDDKLVRKKKISKK